MRLKENDLLSTQQILPISKLRRVLSDLKETNDIEGAALVGAEDKIITHDLPKRSNYESEIPQIMTLFKDLSDFALRTHFNHMFTHCIFEYNGCKVVAKKLKDNLTLLVMLQKHGYVGLAMLDIENSIRRIDDIISDSLPNALT